MTLAFVLAFGDWSTCYERLKKVPRA